ncbi:Polyprotein [Gossypium arboreum]|uniref:Polyprotein n=1 Tax=Gossypium arboreum TaxID=29729 RepID=A0A0B0MSG1_GOSAR|nr:Polyprotein [Gossypium arboreum]
MAVTRACVLAVCDTWSCCTAVCPLVLKLKLGQYAPQGPSTRACDLAVLHKSVYPTSLAWLNTQPGTRACMATSKGTWARPMGVWLAV